MIWSTMMKIFWITLANVAVLGFQPVMAYEDVLPGQTGPARNQATQRGQENSASRLRGQENSPSTPRAPQNVQSKPWEARPWEQAQEDVRPGAVRQKDGPKLEEMRRAGRKAKKERVERQKEKAHALSYEDRVKQRQTRWQRHQLESERYVTGASSRR